MKISIRNRIGISGRGEAQDRFGANLPRACPAWLAKGDAKKQTSEESKRRGHRDLKKINAKVNELEVFHKEKTIRLMFQDEAGFGRINKPKYCWCGPGIRPSVPCHHIREYRYAYGAVEPLTGEGFFLVLPSSDTERMNDFLKELSKKFADDIMLLCCDGAAWHKSKGLSVPDNIKLFYLPPYTPEMNPIEQIWKELRKIGFRNEVFPTLERVVDRLCDAICSLTNTTIRSITERGWIKECFY